MARPDERQQQQRHEAREVRLGEQGLRERERVRQHRDRDAERALAPVRPAAGEAEGLARGGRGDRDRDRRPGPGECRECRDRAQDEASLRDGRPEPEAREVEPDVLLDRECEECPHREARPLPAPVAEEHREEREREETLHVEDVIERGDHDRAVEVGEDRDVRRRVAHAFAAQNAAERQTAGPQCERLDEEQQVRRGGQPVERNEERQDRGEVLGQEAPPEDRGVEEAPVPRLPERLVEHGEVVGIGAERPVLGERGEDEEGEHHARGETEGAGRCRPSRQPGRPVAEPGPAVRACGNPKRQKAVERPGRLAEPGQVRQPGRHPVHGDENHEQGRGRGEGEAEDAGEVHLIGALGKQADRDFPMCPMGLHASRWLWCEECC